MEMNQTTQNAYNKLRETLELSDAVDLSVIISNANVRINRLQEQLNNTYDPEKAKDKLNLAIGPHSIRRFAIKLLDDENGIDKKAYEILSILLIETGNEDILEHVDVTEDRAYIGETYGEEEMIKLEAERWKGTKN